MSELNFAPGQTIGILGGGQLGRMIAQAAQQLGFRVAIFTSEDDAPASQITNQSIIADYDDRAALSRFAASVDLITYEFENIPVEAVAFLAESKPVRPSPKILRICQDRAREKDMATRLGFATTPNRVVTSFAALGKAADEIGFPAVLKATRMGYDGRGQARIDSVADLALAWREVSAPTAILEGFVDFVFEASVIVARGVDGAMAFFTPSENRHTNHILSETHVPGQLTAAQAAEAIEIASKFAVALDLIGLLCVELFITKDGRLLVNELAPRPHNSGHWSLDAAVTSQFEQLVRAITGLPLGSTARLADAVMYNLIGDEVHEWRDFLGDPTLKLHLYGKSESRPGRKMGHVTKLILPDR